MDDPIFQRLKRLKQLGCAEHVFPTATHSRFEHSLGVAHLAEQLCRRLKALAMPQGAEAPSERDILCVKLEGLCHDLGHGPFSHMFEQTVKDFKHAAMSIKLLHRLFARGDGGRKLSDFSAGGERLDDEQDLLFIEELIDGVKPPHRRGRDRSKWYLYDIVSNGNFGLDVDRLDYLLRDRQCCIGPGSPFVPQRIFSNAEVRLTAWEGTNGRLERYPVIVFSQKAAPELWQVFSSRYEMFEKVYLHHNVTGRELLLQDVFKAFIALPAPWCEPVPGMTLAQAVADPTTFVELDDHINSTMVRQVKALQHRVQQETTLDGKTRDLVQEAIAVVHRSRRHAHYTTVVDLRLDPAVGDGDTMLVLKDGSSLPLTSLQRQITKLDPSKDRYRVEIRAVHHGEKEENPMAQMRFFDGKEDTIDTLATPLKRPELHYPVPVHFQLRSCCIYFTGEAAEKPGAHEEIQHAIRAAREENQEEP